MYLFDTLSGLKKYINDQKTVTIYLCGPTLYDQLHLGNLRPIITFDFIVRYLKSKNIKYHYVQNLTDVDEKIIKKAFDEKRSVKEITSEYYRSFLEILGNLNVILPNNFPLVSENIREIQRVIECLLSSKSAYWDKKKQTIKFNQITKDHSLNYFYSTDSPTLDEADFALWKENRISTFNFESPWFGGIPGWHIECFSMIQKYFELPISIHGGGVDLKFPHHENENLLCRTLFNKDLAECWVHVGQVHNNEGKLSKSSNLQFTIKECASTYSWSFLRYIFMKTKYHKPITITYSILSKYWSEWRSYMSALLYSEVLLLSDNASLLLKKEVITSPEKEFLDTLENQLNLPDTLSWLENTKKLLLNSLKNKDLTQIHRLSAILKYHLEWLGFTVEILKDNQKNKALYWLNLINNQEYKAADILRTQLKEEGVIP